VADEVTVDGRGVYDRLEFKNQDNRLVFRMYAPGGKCRIDAITVKVRDRDGTKYRLTGWCEDGEWHKRLSRRGHTVQCDDLRLMYKPSGGFWRAVVPRECLDGLANRVKVVRSRVYTGTAVGKAGPTRYVARG